MLWSGMNSRVGGGIITQVVEPVPLSQKLGALSINLDVKLGDAERRTQCAGAGLTPDFHSWVVVGWGERWGEQGNWWKWMGED